MSRNVDPNLDPEINPTARRYGLSLRIKKIRKSSFQGIKERLWKTSNEYTAIILELVYSERQNAQFYNAWEPADRPEYDEMGNIVKNHPPEVILELTEKPFGSCRCFVMKVDNDSPDYPYLLVSSVGTEKDIDKFYKNGDFLKAISYSSVDDDKGDGAYDPEYNHEHYGDY